MTSFFNTYRWFVQWNSTDIAGYANVNSLYYTSSITDAIIQKLNETAKSLFSRFTDNYMEVNASKCYFLLPSGSRRSLSIEGLEANSFKVKKIGVHVDHKPYFKSHIKFYVKRLVKTQGTSSYNSCKPLWDRKSIIIHLKKGKNWLVFWNKKQHFRV